MRKSDSLVALFKLGKRTHMEELIHEGHVYMNAVSYFKDLEEDSPRSDDAEGTWYCQKADGAILEKRQGPEWHRVATLNGPALFRKEALAKANLYCLHGKTQKDYGRVFELHRFGYGDSYVLFRDPSEFLGRLSKAANEAGQKIECRVVEYVDKNSYSGPMGLFRKFSERAEDREVRIALLPGTGDPFSLWLGDLSDIALFGSASQRLRLDRKVPPRTP